MAEHAEQAIPPLRPQRSAEEWVAEIERRARAAMAGEPGLLWEEVRSSIEWRLYLPRRAGRLNP